MRWADETVQIWNDEPAVAERSSSLILQPPRTKESTRRLTDILKRYSTYTGGDIPESMSLESLVKRLLDQSQNLFVDLPKELKWSRYVPQDLWQEAKAHYWYAVDYTHARGAKLNALADCWEEYHSELDDLRGGKHRGKQLYGREHQAGGDVGDEMLDRWLTLVTDIAKSS